MKTVLPTDQPEGGCPQGPEVCHFPLLIHETLDVFSHLNAQESRALQNTNQLFAAMQKNCSLFKKEKSVKKWAPYCRRCLKHLAAVLNSLAFHQPCSTMLGIDLESSRTKERLLVIPLFLVDKSILEVTENFAMCHDDPQKIALSLHGGLTWLKCHEWVYSSCCLSFSNSCVYFSICCQEIQLWDQKESILWIYIEWLLMCILLRLLLVMLKNFITLVFFLLSIDVLEVQC